MYEAIVFDLDGVIVDSEPLQSRSFERVLSGLGCAFEVDSHGIVHEIGKSALENLVMLSDRYNIDHDFERLAEPKSRALSRHYQ